MFSSGINSPNMPATENVETLRFPVGGGRSAFMVALGNNRSNGASLGAFYLNANNGLTNSNGNNWRARASYATTQDPLPKKPSLEVLDTGHFADLLSQLNRTHTTETARTPHRRGVKDLHESGDSSFICRTLRAEKGANTFWSWYPTLTHLMQRASHA